MNTAPSNLLLGCGPHCSCGDTHPNGHTALSNPFVSSESLLSAGQSLPYSETYAGNEGSSSALFSGDRWFTGEGTTNLNYKFISSLPSYYPNNAEEAVGFTPFNNQMIAATQNIFNHIESFANISFSETTNANTYGTITLASAAISEVFSGWAYLPTTLDVGGDVWINTFFPDTQSPEIGNTAYYLLLHEIGHSLGLGHSFEQFTGDEATSRFSVMSYDIQPGISTSYMLYDIAAIQAIYGANNTHALGDDSYAVNSGTFETIWDAGGNDTINALSSSVDSIIDLTPGSFSSIDGAVRNLAIAFNASLENVIAGAGNDIIGGNDARNDLRGNSGNDTIYGGGGDDLIYGGSGNDILHGESGIDRLYGNNGNDELYGGEDTDYLFAHAGDDTLNGDAGIDYLFGGSGEDTLNGGIGDDFLYGNADNDTLNGEEGADYLNGHAGNDELNGGIGDDIINGHDGNDTIYGGSQNDTIDGGLGDDRIYGQSGDDILYGGGGSVVFMVKAEATHLY